MVLKDGAVMSKSKGNVVDPDTMIQKVGADALRHYVMFVAPPEKEVEWTDSGLEGSARWLHRVWRIAQQWRSAPASALDPPRLTATERAMRRKTHDTIRRVTFDVDARKQFNTAESAMMELVNDLYAFTDKQEELPSPQAGAVAREALEALIVMMSPFAPHTAEELWEQYGHGKTLSHAVWPIYDAEVARAEQVTIPVQVNGKVRSRVTASPDASDSELETLALADPAIQAHTAGKTIRRVVVAKGRLVSVVAG
jgi:leucyl-tRNA synthetase